MSPIGLRYMSKTIFVESENTSIHVISLYMKIDLSTMPILFINYSVSMVVSYGVLAVLKCFKYSIGIS